MSSNDYYDHITRLVRTPSVATADVPRYGNAPMFFRGTKMFTNREAEKQDDHSRSDNKKHHQSPQFNENVEVFKYEQPSADQDNITDGNPVNDQVCDDEANRFIEQRRKGFQLCQWKTFKSH